MVLFHKPVTFEQRYLDPKAYRRKWCTCMSLRGGCALACAIWLGVNVYIAALSFQGYTPIFSFLNRPALITLGSISIVFALVAAWILYGLFVNLPNKLQSGAALLIFTVPIYLADIFANIIIFGVQKPQYMDWCLQSSQNVVDETMQGINLNSTYYNIETLPPTTVYNCEKLWEDEIKFSIAVFFLMGFCYIYWTMCVFFYYEKLRELFPDNSTYLGGYMNYLFRQNRMLPQHSFANVPPPSK
ncbi:hypothetical protein BD408DRAFT_447381 [Parasitella parasitica]|nr:hypothetical protein BD408DRAFT_447381 [Parasitella parasitica]